MTYDESMIGIIFNPTSRNGESKGRMANFLTMMDEAGLEYNYRETQAARDATKFAIEMSETCSTIVSAGGDGTLFEIINGIWEKDVRLAILPFGSGNDLANGLYGKKYSEKEALEIIRGDKSMKVDCGRVNDQYTMCLLCGFGIVTNVCVRYKERGGSYVSNIMPFFIHSLKKHYKVIVDGHERAFYSEFVNIMNDGIIGGGLHITPSSVVNDGKMELGILHESGSLKRIAAFGSLPFHKIEKRSVFETIHFEECTIIPESPEICNIDGELIEFSEIHLKVLKEKLTFGVI
ncbi:MAG: hypothetical protein E7Z64_06880 [Thermoplasmata archaeon]|nr:hypothetical protein [Thermoplasmata archaeon]